MIVKIINNHLNNFYHKSRSFGAFELLVLKMDMSLSPDQKHTLRLLDAVLKKEQETWLPSFYCPETNLQHLISSTDRRVVVWWMIRVNRMLKFSKETLFLAVGILDKFLRIVKVQQKYLKCIGISCLYIAAKIIEEDEVVPRTSDLIKISECGYSVKEITRMELCILNQLRWNVNLATPIDILHLLYNLFLSHCKEDKIFENRQHIKYLYCMTRLLNSSLWHHQFLSFPPSIIALSILSLQLRLVWPYWKAATDELMSIMKIDSNELNNCCMLVTSLMSDILLSSVKSSRRSRTLLKRKSEEDEDISEGIKKLYTDDSAGNNASSSLMSCRGELSRFNVGHFTRNSGKAT